MIDLSRVRIPPRDYQVAGVTALIKWDDPGVGRTIPGVFFLADEMGIGKTKQAIDAAQVLWEQGEISRVVVIAPNSVCSVWYEPELGELRKHLWETTPALVTKHHGKERHWRTKHKTEKVMHWVITNYEFIRNEDRLEEFIDEYTDGKTLLILDESSAVKSHKAHQTRACFQIRKECRRVWLLNGTPAISPGDMFSQGVIMDWRILGFRTWAQFKSYHAILGGYMQKQIIGWRAVEELQTKFAPYILRREKKDWLDLPPKLPSVALTVPLDRSTWKIYKEMKQDLVAWLEDQTVAVSSQAGVKAMRLAQITSGFVGGIQEVQTLDMADFQDAGPLPDYLAAFAGLMNDTEGLPGSTLSPPLPASPAPVPAPAGEAPASLPPKEIGREKLDFFLTWFKQKVEDDPGFKLLVWCRFRPELARLMAELDTLRYGTSIFSDLKIGEIRGGQKREDREAALRLLDPRTAPLGPVVVAGTPSSGSMGLNLTAAHTVYRFSNVYSLKDKLQSDDRVHRHGQEYPVSYFDSVATGPDGQRTIDHSILKALINRENVAKWTTSRWISELAEEEPEV